MRTRTSSPLSDDESAELAALRAARDLVEPFDAFVARVAASFAVVPPHLRPLYDLIQRTRYEQVFATVSMPPRHGKTTSLALALAWRILYDPACLNFYTTYAGDRASNLGAAVLRLVQRLGVPLDARNQGASDFRTTFSGAAGNPGGLISTSVNGQITGEGANGGLVVCDDLLKGFKQARSKTQRDDIHGYLTTDVLSRIEGGASCILINTRWHLDDSIGRIQKGDLADYGFIHINMPAVHDGKMKPIDERKEDDGKTSLPAGSSNPRAVPLWLDVDSANPGDVGAALKWYRRSRSRGELAWWSLYQGVPRNDGSKVFHENPARYRTPFDWTGKRGIIVMDPAATKGTSSNYTAIGVIAVEGRGENAKAYVVHAEKRKLEVPDAVRLGIAYQKRWRLPCAIEAVAGFKSVPQQMREIARSLGMRFRIKAVAPRGDKFTRAQLAATMWNDGRLMLPAEVDGDGCPIDVGWDVGDLILVAEAFTGNDDAEDDFVDMMAHGVNELMLGTSVPGESEIVDPYADDKRMRRILAVEPPKLNRDVMRPELDYELGDPDDD